MAELKLCITGK